jgi:D-alanine-D-alanine ligase
MKKLIVVLNGGLSGERKISFLTAKACSVALKRKGFKVINLDAKGFFSENLRKLKPKIVFNALHGKFGEDGFVQSILESLKIPYTHSGIISSSLAMDKELSKIIFKKNKLRVPKYFLLKKDNIENLLRKIKKNNIKFPIVVKPVNEGSSLGVHICKNIKALKTKCKKLFINYSRVLIEEYIPGKEIQVAVMGRKPLGAIELHPKRKFYDYAAKYSSSAGTKHIMPANLLPHQYKEVLSIALKAHNALGCKGITRSDFRFFNKKFYLLETNTQPGMTKLSLVPEIANYCGINFDDLVLWMVKDASCKR